MNLQLLQQELTRDEGCKFSPYADTRGIQTVGIGHNLQASPIDLPFPLNQAQVTLIFSKDIQNVFDALDAKLPWWRSLDEVRQRVVANMCFNMGINTLLTFKNTLAAMSLGNYEQAANGMRNSTWAKQVGQRAARLSTAMQTGVMPS